LERFFVVEYTLCGNRCQTAGIATPFQVWRFSDSRPWAEFRRIPAGYHLRFPDLAEFEISSDGRRILGFPAPNISDATVEHLYLNQVLPLALSRGGKLVVHACAVEVNGSALVFIGDTGRGKSTLAAAFAIAEYRFLADDCLVVAAEGEEFFAVPSHPSIRLWQDSHEQLLDKDAAKAPPVTYTSKVRFLAGDVLTYCNEPRPLRAAYVLGPGETVSIDIKRLSEANGLIAFATNAFMLDIEDRTQIAAHFCALARVANEIPCFHLDYPRDFADLPRVLDAVARHATGLECSQWT
jgi:hypothetical protein